MFQMNRRDFMKGASATTASLAIGGCVTSRIKSANEKLNVGVIGVGGKGWSDWTPLFGHGENIVALCDVDRGQIDRALEEIKKKGVDPSNVKCYSDYRKMLDECGDKLDACTVSTPDHTHAPAAIRAMKLGCHVYVQKPLVRTIWEAHSFEKVARKMHVITQMGNQGSADSGLRRNVEVLRKGVLGNITEVHVWTNRPIWPQGIARPEGEDEIPISLDWESWLGTAPYRPFKKDVYHTFKWRGFFDFGTGAFGDMACHTMNVPFRGLELGAVESAECKTIEGTSDDTYPSKSVVLLHYAARGEKPAVDLYWYDGNLKPDINKMPRAEIANQITATLGKVPNTGCLIIGDKGIMISENDYGALAYIGLTGEEKLKSVAKHEACLAIPEYLPRSKEGHNLEFANAIRGIETAFSDIDVSVPMLEGMLVGCIAQRVPGKLLWNSKKQKFDNPAATALIRQEVRKGWEF